MTLPPTQKSLLPTTGEGHYLQPRRVRLGRDAQVAPSRRHDGTAVAGSIMQGQSQQVTSSVQWPPVPTLGYDARLQRRMDYFVSRWRSFLDQVEDDLVGAGVGFAKNGEHLKGAALGPVRAAALLFPRRVRLGAMEARAHHTSETSKGRPRWPPPVLGSDVPPDYSSPHFSNQARR